MTSRSSQSSKTSQVTSQVTCQATSQAMVRYLPRRSTRSHTDQQRVLHSDGSYHTGRLSRQLSLPDPREDSLKDIKASAYALRDEIDGLVKDFNNRVDIMGSSSTLMIRKDRLKHD